MELKDYAGLTTGLPVQGTFMLDTHAECDFTPRMDEKDILKFLEEKAADSGFKSARFVIENVPINPCAVYVDLSERHGPSTYGFGNTFAEAVAQAKDRQAKTVKR